MLPPSGLRSTPALPFVLLMQPSVYRKAAIRKGPRPTVHWRDFVQRRTREEYDLVLFGNNCLIAARAHSRIAALPGVVETQIPSLELDRFTMAKIYEQIGRASCRERV